MQNILSYLPLCPLLQIHYLSLTILAYIVTLTIPLSRITYSALSINHMSIQNNACGTDIEQDFVN